MIGNDFEHNFWTQLAACHPFPVIIVLNQPIVRQREKPAWWLDPAKRDWN